MAAAERSGGERSEPQRSAAAANAGADSLPTSWPDPEVVAKPKRRTYTAEYKLGILQEAEAVATTRGGIGALLRREGLYSSLLATWRRERANGILEALTPQKRGPKGIGFEPSPFVRSDGVGLIGMRERVLALGGTLDLDSAPGRGTRIIACIPTTPPQGLAA